MSWSSIFEYNLLWMYKPLFNADETVYNIFSFNLYINLQIK